MMVLKSYLELIKQIKDLRDLYRARNYLNYDMKGDIIIDS